VVVGLNLHVSALGVKLSLKLPLMFFVVLLKKILDVINQVSYQGCITTNQGGHT
jgi:hypothetical protein